MKAVGLYARVSSEAQEKQATVDSQVAALVERAKSDGHAVVASDIFVDDGYSGSTLVRPALERVRDRAADGTLDVLYVHSPDRLARRYAYQVVLLEELARCGTSVVFLNGMASHSAEDELLVQVQGVIAEYERAKILERSRRGKLHKARSGSVNPLSGAPYGYRYVRKTDSDRAQYQVVLHEAKVVRRIFRWFVEEQLSVYGVAKRLSDEHVPTRTGRPSWNTAVVWNMLRNPAYAGRAAFGKTEVVARHAMLRPPRGRSGIPRHEKSSVNKKPPSEWVTVPVPALVSEATFGAAQEQLHRNRRLSPRNGETERYLLQGLTVCACCGFAYHGRTIHRRDRAKPPYVYYACGSNYSRRFGADGTVCRNPGVQVGLLDQHVWESVRAVLEHPDQVVREWTRRIDEGGALDDARGQRDEAQRLVITQRRTLDRLQDAYEAGALTVTELAQRTQRVRARIHQAEQDLAEAQTDLSRTVEIRALAGKLTSFAEQVRGGLDGLDWHQRRHLVRTLVSRVEIDGEGATIVYRIPAPRPPGEPTPAPPPDQPPGLSGEGAGPICRLHSGRERSGEGHERRAWRRKVRGA